MAELIEIVRVKKPTYNLRREYMQMTKDRKGFERTIRLKNFYFICEIENGYREKNKAI